MLRAPVAAKAILRDVQSRRLKRGLYYRTSVILYQLKRGFRYLLKTYKDVFLGSTLVDWLTSEGV
jgi:hypothetical protein